MSKMNMKFALNLEDMKSIHLERYDQNFTFIVDGKKYVTSRILADLISPIVNNYHYEDESINEITINTNKITKLDIKKENDTDQDYFSSFLSLCTFDEQEIDDTKKKLYSEYFNLLGNVNECTRLQQECLVNLSPENVIDRLKLFSNDEICTKKSEIIDQLITYASSIFENISKEEMKQLNIGIIEEIISNESLKLDNEDSLLEFILDLCKIDSQNSKLFEYVIFKNIEEKSFDKFITEFNIEYINSIIWLRICQRFSSSTSSLHQKNFFLERYNKQIIRKEFNEDEEMNGILKYLTNQTGGNIHDNGTVNITSNSIFNTMYHPKNLVDVEFDSSNCYQSKSSIPNAFVCFDFKNKKIQLTSYSIRTHKNCYHLKNWLIEVSNDGSKWTTIDEHKNDSTLNSPIAVGNFKINEETDFYRFIRLRQTGLSWANSFQTLFYSIEFYGNLIE